MKYATPNKKVSISHKSELGSGIFTIPDICRILKIPAHKARRYMSEYLDNKIGKEIFNDTYSWSLDKRNKAVNFLGLIELHVMFKLRDLGISAQQIIKSRKNISKQFGIQYPFASEKILSDGKTIWYNAQVGAVSMDGHNQFVFLEILRKYLSKIEFDKDSNLAKCFYPLGKKNSIIISPSHQFGQPVIDGTNINAETIYKMHSSGDSIELICRLYDISKKNAKDAIAFFNKAA